MLMADGRVAEVDIREDLGNQLDPPGSGGLVLALHFWRRMLARGPEQYGDVYYLGTAPRGGLNDLVDVLVATYQVTETHFQFDPDSGQLAGLQMYPDLDVDACELIFSGYRELNGRMLPSRLEVRFGDDNVFDLQIEQFEITKAPEKEV